jgi:uncharacterized membrane protein
MMTNLRNLVALAAIVILPLALYLGWEKKTVLAWSTLVVYAAVLGYFTWQSRREK